MIIFDRIERKYGMLKVVLIQMFGAFIIGIIFANVIQVYVGHVQRIFDQMMVTDFGNLSSTQILILNLQRRIKNYLLIWLFSVTILAVPYNVCCILYNGFKVGLVVGEFSIFYGFAGFLRAISLGLPHMLIYIPVTISTVLICYQIHKKVANGLSMRKGRIILEQMPALFLMLALVVVGCFLETYVNPGIIEWIKATTRI